MSKTKPKASNVERGTSTSVFMSRDITHINNVLQVSTVDLCAADAYLVIITPVRLKPAIVKTLQRD